MQDRFNQVTPQELEAAQEWVKACEKVMKKAPDPISPKEWDAAMEEIAAAGKIPEKYRGRIAETEITDENGTKKGYYDLLQHQYDQEIHAINEKYRDAVLKVFSIAMHTDGDYQEQSENALAFVREILERAAPSLAKEQLHEVLPRLTHITPQKHLIPNNKLANSLTQEILNAGMVYIDVGNKEEGEKLKTSVIMAYEGDNVKLTSRQPFSEYDRNVADAVTSLYEYGDESHLVTAATVYRAMVHATETETPSAQQLGAVTRSLDKLRFVRVQIDCSEEIQRRKISLDGSQITGGKIDTYLLALEKIEVLAGGQTVTAYKILKTPILYDYARLTKQVVTVPASLLEIRDGHGVRVANTERRISIKGYLMRRIERMKGKTGYKQSKHIIYDDVYKNVCDSEPSEKDKRLIREYVTMVLESWQHDKYIIGYEQLTHGRKKTGVAIKI